MTKPPSPPLGCSGVQSAGFAARGVTVKRVLFDDGGCYHSKLCKQM